MAKILTSKNGRLKTGRITLVIFLGILLGAALLFKAARPIGQAVVAVTHVFEPQLKQSEPTEPKAKKSSNPKKTVQTSSLPIIAKQLPDPVFENMAERNTGTATDQEQKHDVKQTEEVFLNTEANLKHRLKTEDLHKGMVTVDKQKYMQIFSDWRKAGTANRTDEKVSEKFSLQIENLRQVYELFQMKAVVKTKGVFIDLETSTRIPKEALDQYSSTVFLVDDPWAKWSNELKAAGIKRTDTVDVRYYMYGFIRDSIYARAEKALTWSRQHGNTDQKINPDDADVLGRAFIINQDGGGRFGVFVPYLLTLRNGQEITIDPACFNGDQDVQTLVVAGLL